MSWQNSQGFQDGNFRVVDANPGAGSKFKFEADGYAPFVTRMVGPDEGEVSFDISLYPATPATITVVTPDGEPATNASIGLQFPGTFLNLMPGRLMGTQEAHGEGAYTNVFSTDQAGRFDLPRDDAITGVIAACPAGYVETTPAALAGNATMRLQPWGRIEGTILSGGKPVVGRTLFLAPVPGWLTRAMSYIFEVGTDANGHFSFTNVPPRNFYLLLQELPNPWKNGVGSRSARGQAVTVRSGETTTVALELYSVTARPVWPAGLEPQADWQVEGTVDLIPRQGELPGFLPHSLAETVTGIWRSDDIPAGNYSIHFRVFDQGSDIFDRKPLFHGEAPLVIPDHPSSGTLDAGEITLQPVQ